MLWVVLAIFAAALAAPVVERWAHRATGWVLALVPAGAFVYFASMVPLVGAEEGVRQAWSWVPSMGVRLAFYLDGLSLLFALLVTGIGALIVVYSNGYMAHHPQRGRFFAFLLGFAASMLGLVLADDFWTFFVFFELTSLSSYLLIGFEHEDEEARRAARQALVVTGGGGLALLAGLVLLEQAAGVASFSEVLTAAPTEAVQASGLYGAILVLICAGAFAKSAQMPLHFWLPAAMAGPTPVSAYLHSATMVKAGVYLLARLSPVLGGTAAWTTTLVGFGGVTMLVTAWLALRHTDVKLVLAYTTLMVLGLLVMLLGLGGEEAVLAAMVFILVHGLYKGALFMVAGNLDHETGTRDLTQLGGLRRAMPLTTIAGVATALSMGGVPPLFGFVGKELVYEAVLTEDPLGGGLLIVSILANAALIGVSLVLAFKPFFGRAIDAADTPELPGRVPLSMGFGPLVLGGLGLVFGVWPLLLDDVLMAPAASAVLAEPVEEHLALWHGLTPPLAWSALTLVLGIALALGWEHLRRMTAMGGLETTFGSGPARLFERALYALSQGARLATRALQSGRLRYYVLTVLAVTVLLLGGAYAVDGGLSWPEAVGWVRYYEAVLVAVIAGGALVAAVARSRFVAILALGTAGYSIALLYLLFGAPDLAMTQFAIETLTVILLALVLVGVPRRNVEAASVLSRVRDAVVAACVGGVVTMTMLSVLRRPLDHYLSDFMTEHAVPDAHGHNIVNVILVDFRAFDTLGEITVLSMAGLGVYALMRLRTAPGRPSSPSSSSIKEASS